MSKQLLIPHIDHRIENPLQIERQLYLAPRHGHVRRAQPLTRLRQSTERRQGFARARAGVREVERVGIDGGRGEVSSDFVEHLWGEAGEGVGRVVDAFL